MRRDRLCVGRFARTGKLVWWVYRHRSERPQRPAGQWLRCLRDYFSVGMHVPQGGWVITAACQRHGVHVDTRQFVYERTQVVGLVPGTWDEEQ